MVLKMSRLTFQLTPSRRATTRTILPATPRLHFNSRPHGGRPTGSDFDRLSEKAFQLTPSRRATARIYPCSRPIRISTHALTEGDFPVLQDRICHIFQLTPSRRATSSSNGLSSSTLFQLTPSRRATANLDKFFF